MKVFFIVGEDSGDAIASNLIKHLKNLKGDDIECLGIGGPMMEAAGFETLLSMDKITAFGIWEVIPKIPALLKVKDALIKEIEKLQPDAVVTVDFPEFNFITAKALKKRGIYKGKIIHYVAPSVWAWREGRAKKIARIIDGIMCLFPMEVEYFTKQGIKAAYVGHPLVERFVETAQERSYRVLNEIPNDTVILGLFFGSRESEFKNMKDVLIESAKHIIDMQKNIHIIVPTLAKNEFYVQSFLDGLKASVFVSANPNFKWTAFQACDVAIAVSGTVGLELAYAKVPHVITYKVSTITYFILKLLVKVKKAHLINILLKKDVVPEFIQSNAEPEKIAESILEIIKKPEKRQEMIQGFEELRELLGANNSEKPSLKAAEFVLSMIAGTVAEPMIEPVTRKSIKAVFNTASSFKV